MTRAYVEVLNEVEKEYSSGYKLCYQKCTYHYSDDSTEYGYRFIWRNSNRSLLPHMGQARIPSTGTALELISMAVDAGWACENFSDSSPLPNFGNDQEFDGNFE